MMAKPPLTASEMMRRELDATVKRATTFGGASSVDKAIRGAMESQRLFDDAIGGSAVARALKDLNISNQFSTFTRSVAEQAVIDQQRLLKGVVDGSKAFSASDVFPPPKPLPPPALTSAADLAPLIRKARKRMGMNQQAFADAAGVGRRFLSELENGKPSLEFDKVLACAQAAGIDIMAKPRLPL
jgi:y4mF family transcriptional regulator